MTRTGLIAERATRALAQFIIGIDDDDVPARARNRIVDAMIDSIGCAFLGTQHALMVPMSNIIATTDRPIGRSSNFVIGLNR